MPVRPRSRPILIGHRQAHSRRRKTAVVPNPVAVDQSGDFLDVVGYFAPGGGLPIFAFLYTNGQMLDLNTLLPPQSGWTTLQTAYGISDSGQIAGFGSRNGVYRAFLMTPVG